MSFVCRPGCAACCTTISISSALPGMPAGKPAGVRCVNLSADNRCRLWGSAAYPLVCTGFQPSVKYCGNTNEEAHRILGALEKATAPPYLAL